MQNKQIYKIYIFVIFKQSVFQKTSITEPLKMSELFRLDKIKPRENTIKTAQGQNY